MDLDLPQYPISFVARRTGLTTHVIRVWERRYQAVSPSRSDTQRRRYSEADVERLRLLAKLTQSGHAIGQIAALSTEELRAQVRALQLRSATPPETVGPAGEADAVQGLLGECQAATASLNREALEAALQEARVLLPPMTVLEDLIAPLMIWVGEEWHRNRLRAGQEHFASAAVRDFLMRLRAGMPVPPGARVIVVTTPTGEQHEIGAMLAACAALLDGWRDLYLGASLPASELAHAAAQAHATVVALSISGAAPAAFLNELEDLRRLLAPEVEIVVGGAGVARLLHRVEVRGVHFVQSLRGLQEWLRSL